MIAILEMRDVSMRFPGTLAVDQVSFDVKPGEVHALMGENGAGKSTLMNMMAGSFDTYTGSILVGGETVKLHAPALAKEQGIEMIHQELYNALPLTIAENIFAGNLPTKSGFLVDRKKLMQDTETSLQRVGLSLNPMTRIEALSPHEQQLVEIAKALSNHPKILIMDEPTSSLSRTEVQKLFKIIDQLKSEGLAIVYISHHIPEIFRVADRATVLRDGKKVFTDVMDNLTPEKLVDAMVGKAISKTHVLRKRTPADISYRFHHLSRLGFFHDVNFEIRKGEVLSIAGLAGSGRSEIARSFCAIDPLDAGHVSKDGEVLPIYSYKDAIRLGFAYLSEDRKSEGLALDQESVFNAMSAVNVKETTKSSLAEREKTYLQLAHELSVYPPDPTRLVNQYSGGNQQKILLAKWMAVHPDLLILDEPTRGVDIGAKQLIHEVIGRLADEGMCILLITSDLPELVELADRVLILHKGQIVQEMVSDFTEESILLAANGENP